MPWQPVPLCKARFVRRGVLPSLFCKGAARGGRSWAPTFSYVVARSGGGPPSLQGLATTSSRELATASSRELASSSTGPPLAASSSPTTRAQVMGSKEAVGSRLGLVSHDWAPAPDERTHGGFPADHLGWSAGELPSDVLVKWGVFYYLRPVEQGSFGDPSHGGFQGPQRQGHMYRSPSGDLFPTGAGCRQAICGRCLMPVRP